MKRRRWVHVEKSASVGGITTAAKDTAYASGNDYSRRFRVGLNTTGSTMRWRPSDQPTETGRRMRNFICEATGTHCTDKRCKLGHCVLEAELKSIPDEVLLKRLLANMSHEELLALMKKIRERK